MKSPYFIIKTWTYIGLIMENNWIYIEAIKVLIKK